MTIKLTLPDFSIIIGSQGEELEEGKCITSIVKSKEDNELFHTNFCSHSVCSPCLYSLGTNPLRTLLSTFRLGLPLSINIIKMIPKD